MALVVLPFNAGPDTRHALARQFVNFACDIVRSTGAEVGSVNYLARTENNENAPVALFNPSETLNEAQMLEQLFTNMEADRALDGLLVETESGFTMTTRLWLKGESEPADVRESTFLKPGLFAELRNLVLYVGEHARAQFPEGGLPEGSDLFGTDNPDVFLKFLEGHDVLFYISQTGGNVLPSFDPDPQLQGLVEAVEADPEWEGPYLVALSICRACIRSRIGSADSVMGVLDKLAELVPDDARAFFAKGELFEANNMLSQAADLYEKAALTDPNESGFLAHLGRVQLQLGMPANAERNIRKAIDLEPDEKPSLDLLAQALGSLNRAHEIPALWREQVGRTPQNAMAHAKLAVSLIQSGNEPEGVKVFEGALESLEDSTFVKRFYAPYLAQKDDHDRAMDFYEDYLEAQPEDIQAKLEYADLLEAAGREFEVPGVLKEILQANIEPGLRGQVMGKLIELEQPKRAEAVASAQAKAENGEFEAAIRELKPLSNWLGDYWKLWWTLAACYNRVGEAEEAEQAANRLLNLVPNFAPAYVELAQALGAQNKQEEAYMAMRYARMTFPQDLMIAVNFALAANRSGHRDEALQVAKSIREFAAANQPELLEQLGDFFREIETV